MIRHNTDLVGTLDDHLLDEDVRKQLLELSEELHDDKREALAVFNNKVEEKLPTMHEDCIEAVLWKPSCSMQSGSPVFRDTHSSTPHVPPASDHSGTHVSFQLGASRQRDYRQRDNKAPRLSRANEGCFEA